MSLDPANSKGQSSPSHAPSLALALLALAAPCVGCSFVFSESAGDEREAIDAGGEDVDADDFGFSCGAPLPNPVAHFPIDGDLGQTSIKTRQGVALGEVKKRIDGVLVESTLAGDDGPAPQCGSGIAVSNAVNGDYIRIKNDAGGNLLADVQAVDFWFKPTSAVGLVDSGALLTKDATESNRGDLSVTVFRDNSGSYVLLRLQSAASEFLNCSDAIEIGEWYHVAVSVGGDSGATMYVYGLLSVNSTPFIMNDIGDGAQCANLSQGNEAQFVDFSTNTNDWMWGASNHEFDPDLPEGTNNLAATDTMPMVMDELRFRGKAFTPDEALEAYEAVMVPPTPAP